MISDADLLIRDVVARWPGTMHDSVIYDLSWVKRQILNEPRFAGGWFLGDGGYASTPQMLTPFLDPVLQGEIRYNEAHKRQRGCAERLIGVWKGRFRCILQHESKLRFRSLRKCARCILATAVLHNIAILLREESNFDGNWVAEYQQILAQEEAENPANPIAIDDWPNLPDNQIRQLGKAVRDTLVEERFNY